ncbi:hypothetical protein SLA2020_338970 [Shorea laevis]
MAQTLSLSFSSEDSLSPLKTTKPHFLPSLLKPFSTSQNLPILLLRATAKNLLPLRPSQLRLRPNRRHRQTTAPDPLPEGPNTPAHPRLAPRPKTPNRPTTSVTTGTITVGLGLISTIRSCQSWGYPNIKFGRTYKFDMHEHPLTLLTRARAPPSSMR